MLEDINRSDHFQNNIIKLIALKLQSKQDFFDLHVAALHYFAHIYTCILAYSSPQYPNTTYNYNICMLGNTAVYVSVCDLSFFFLLSITCADATD